MYHLLILFLVLELNICNEETIRININNQSRNNNSINKTLYYNKKKNLIFGVIKRYSFTTIIPFFKSLLHANFHNCDIVMFVKSISPTLINYLKNIGVIVYEITEKYKNFSVVKLRWKLYMNFLMKKKDEYNLILSADVRDTIFQKDIFKYYENYNKSFLGIAIEDGTLNEEFNKRWIIDFVGEEKYKIIQNERIICAGTIWGTLDKFLELSQILWEKLLISPKTYDQGIFNYLFYHEKIFNDCIIKSDNYGPIMTIRLTDSKNISLDMKNNILNFKGEIASIIHQYDNKLDIKMKIINKYCPELLVFNEFSNKLNKIIFISLLELLVIILLLKAYLKKEK